MSAPKIKRVELKGLKTLNTNDGYAFNASIYINGKRAVLIHNGGTGGPNQYDWTPSGENPRYAHEEGSLPRLSSPLADAFRQWCVGHPATRAFVESMRKGDPDRGMTPIPDYEATCEVEDVVVEELINDYEEIRYIKRKSKTVVLFRTPDMTKAGEFRQVHHNGDAVGAIRWILKEFPDARIYGHKHQPRSQGDSHE